MLWFAQICLGINELHKNEIIHGNLNVKSILLNKDGQIKVSGLCTPKLNIEKYYVSPETFRTDIRTMKSDIWQLGIIFHYMIILEKPFQAHDLESLRDQIEYDSLTPLPNHYSDNSR